jgi:hypothetical protein
MAATTVLRHDDVLLLKWNVKHCVVGCDDSANVAAGKRMAAIIRAGEVAAVMVRRRLRSAVCGVRRCVRVRSDGSKRFSYLWFQKVSV